MEWNSTWLPLEGADLKHFDSITCYLIWMSQTTSQSFSEAEMIINKKYYKQGFLSMTVCLPCLMCPL